MPLIETPANMDLTQDAHKLLLKRDLDQLAKAIELLQTRVDVVEDEPAKAPLYPATLVPTLGRFAEVATLEQATSLALAATEGASLHGKVSVTSASTGWGGLLSQNYGSYQRTGEALSRVMHQAWGTNSGGKQQFIADAYGQLPAGLNGWAPNAIEVDWRFNWVTVATDVCSVYVNLVVNGVTVSSKLSQFTATTTSYDTGWQTTTFLSSELGAYGDTPGAMIQIRVQGENVRNGTCHHYLGNVILNWE